MQFKDIVLAEASTEAKVAALAVLVDKELVNLAETVLSTKKLEGPKGEQGLQGPKGEQGDRGQDGSNGLDGRDGVDGKDGKDGKDGVGVSNAYVDFDGSLVIELTDGRQINAGDVVPEGVADKVKLVKSGGGNSQPVLDDIAALEAAVAALQATTASYGTMATQNTNNVAITGGAIDGTAIGATTPAAGTFTTLIGGKDQVNYGQLTGGETTKAVEFKTLGSDTNVALAIRTQGTGAIDLAAGSRGVNISNGGTVTAITRTAAGTGYTSAPTVAITAPTTAGGVQATATCTIATTSASTLGSGGTGYTVNDVLTVSGGTFTTAATFTVSAVSGGVITAITFVQGGVYTALPTNPVATTGGTGTGATINLTTGVINSTFTITNAGSGYVEQPTVTFSGGAGSGAAAYATVGSATVARSLGSTFGFFTPAGVSNSQPSFQVADNSTAVANYLTAVGTSGVPYLQANGTGTNISTAVSSKGTGSVSIWTNSANQVQMTVTHTASAVNYVQVTGAATGSDPVISAQGSDSNVVLRLVSKGSSGLVFQTRGGGTQRTGLQIVDNGASSVNYLQIQSNLTTTAPILSAQGSDTNIDLTLTPKGTGLVRFGTYTAGAPAATGYISIKAANGTTYKVLVGT